MPRPPPPPTRSTGPRRGSPLKRSTGTLAEFDDADDLAAMDVEDRNILSTKRNPLGEMLVLRQVRWAGSTRPLCHQVGPQRLLQFVVACKTLADQRRVARPHHAPVGAINIGHGTPGHAVHVIEELHQLLGGGAAGTVKIIVRFSVATMLRTNPAVTSASWRTIRSARKLASTQAAGRRPWRWKPGRSGQTSEPG